MGLIRCYSNAKAYARNPDVIGIVGSYNSSCSEQQIPRSEPGPERAAGDDQPCEHGHGLSRGWYGVSIPRKTSSICTRQVSGTSFGRRPPAT